MQVIYRYEFTRLYFDKDNRLLYIKWQNSITSEDYMIVMRKMLTLTKELDIKFWLSDGQDTEEISIGDKNWSTDYLKNFLGQTKITKIARLETRNPDYEHLVKSLVLPSFNDGTFKMEVRYFKLLQDALHWLDLEFPVSENAFLTSHVLYELY